MTTVRSLIFAALLGLTLLPRFAHAACTAPAGQEGDQMYNAAYKVMQFCDGTNWFAMSGGGGGGSLPTCPDGDYAVVIGGSWACSSTVDSEVDPYDFTDQTDVALSTLTMSDIVQITGMNIPNTVAFWKDDGISAEYRICSDSSCSTVLIDWTDIGGSPISDSQYIQLRMMSPGTYETAFAPIIAGVGAQNQNVDWQVTTAFAPCTSVGGFCWYLPGDPDGESCDTICAKGSRGGYNAATLTYAGSGGSNANCLAVLSALGAGSGAINNIGAGGYGCYASVGLRYRDTDPTISSAGEGDESGQRACACNN